MKNQVFQVWICVNCIEIPCTHKCWHFITIKLMINTLACVGLTVGKRQLINESNLGLHCFIWFFLVGRIGKNNCPRKKLKLFWRNDNEICGFWACVTFDDYSQIDWVAQSRQKKQTNKADPTYLSGKKISNWLFVCLK